MQDETRTKLLRVTLIVAGAGLCLSGVPLVMPATWLKAMAGLFVAAETLDSIWPEEALFGYLLRSALVSYLWVGIVLLVSASDPGGHRRMVDVAAGMLLLLAVVCVVAGVAGGVPAVFYLGDAVPSFAVAALLFAFRPSKKRVR